MILGKKRGKKEYEKRLNGVLESYVCLLFFQFKFKIDFQPKCYNFFLTFFLP